MSLINHPNENISEKLLIHKTQIDEMLFREKESRELLAMGTVDDSWTAAGFIFGTQTHYKLTAEGTIIFRLEGESNDLPMFEQLAVIHEVDLFKDWIPFCFTSKKIVKLGPAEMIA